MTFELVPLSSSRREVFKREMQEAFQRGAEDYFEPSDNPVLPESHIERSLNGEDTLAYEAMVDGEYAGGAIISVDLNSKRGALEFLFVKHGAQNKGIGQMIWNTVEDMHREVMIWETCTPYFDKRNIHFYINRCGFHAVRFYSKFLTDPNDPDGGVEETDNEYFDGMFEFEKVMLKY